MLPIYYKTIQIYIKRFLTWELNKLYLINLLDLNFHSFLQLLFSLFFFFVIACTKVLHSSEHSRVFLVRLHATNNNNELKTENFRPISCLYNLWESQREHGEYAERFISKIWENKFEYFCSNQLSHRHMRIRLNKYLLCVIISHSL